jgi:DNA polymerase III delta subunit
MTLQLLHGSAINASRKKLQDLKSKFSPDNVVVFEEGVSVQTILGSLLTPSLFPDQQLIVLENPSADLLNCNLSTVACTLILWFDHEVDTKKWPGFEPLFFPEAREISVFPFLDYLAAKDQKAFLEMEKLKQAGFDIHYCLTMAFYLLRNLVSAPKNAPDFVKKKLARQRIKFGPEDIKTLYKDLLKIDFKIKSGLLEKSQAEFLLVNKFIGKPTL